MLGFFSLGHLQVTENTGLKPSVNGYEVGIRLPVCLTGITFHPPFVGCLTYGPPLITPGGVPDLSSFSKYFLFVVVFRFCFWFLKRNQTGTMKYKLKTGLKGMGYVIYSFDSCHREFVKGSLKSSN